MTQERGKGSRSGVCFQRTPPSTLSLAPPPGLSSGGALRRGPKGKWIESPLSSVNSSGPRLGDSLPQGKPPSFLTRTSGHLAEERPGTSVRGGGEGRSHPSAAPGVLRASGRGSCPTPGFPPGGWVRHPGPLGRPNRLQPGGSPSGSQKGPARGGAHRAAPEFTCWNGCAPATRPGVLWGAATQRELAETGLRFRPGPLEGRGAVLAPTEAESYAVIVSYGGASVGGLW